MTAFRHVVITRLNLTLDFARQRDTLDVEWLERRLVPFERLCRPAMAAQAAPHDWLVLVDAGTPAAILERLRGVRVVKLEQPHTVEAVGRAVRDEIDLAGATHLITTRLDSDDVLARDHLARVQRHARPTNRPEFLNHPVGTIFDGRRLFLTLDVANPFISHVEPVSRRPGWTPATAYRVAHMWAGRVAPVRQIASPPAWLQVIHADNEVSQAGGLRWPGRRPPPSLRGAGVELDPEGRLAEFARTAPRYFAGARWVVRAALKARRGP